MRRTWTKVSAVNYLMIQGGEQVSTNCLIMTRHLQGLKACSAFDYLKNEWKMIMII